MITGHRDVRGDTAHHVRHLLREVLRSLLARYPEGLVAVSGMAVGADMEFVDAALSLDIPIVAAIPVADQDSVWPWSARLRYADQLRKASLVVNVWEDPQYAEQSYVAAMHARNRWMLDHVAHGDGVIVAVWDGRRRGGTWAAVDGALKRGRKVLVVDPKAYTVRIETPTSASVPAPEPEDEATWPWADFSVRHSETTHWEPIVLEEPEDKPKGFFEDALKNARTLMGRMSHDDVIDTLQYMEWVHKNFGSGR